MSSDLVAAVALIQFGDYLSFVLPTAVLYDYVVLLPQEIDYIWLRPWSFVTFMFFLVRYLGLIAATLDGFFESTFIPGPILTCVVIIFLDTFVFIVFLAASDIVMILRVYALWNKSKIVLGVLLVFYVSQVIIYTVSAAYYLNPHTNMTMTIGQVLDMSFCSPTIDTSNRLGAYKIIPRIILSALLVLLVVGRLCMEVFQSYRETKRLQVNRYVHLLVKEGVLYFLSHLLFLIDFGPTDAGMTMTMLASIVMYIVPPRFIMSVRGLHLANLVHINGRNVGIDTGFGMGKSPRVSVVSTVGFAHSRVTGITLDAAEEDIEMKDLALPPAYSNG